MDPVTAGLSFAASIKKAIEVWENIRKSFARVSQNRRSAQRLVHDIGKDLEALKELYEEHHETLEKSGKTAAAMQTLIENMEHALETCTRLLPPTSEKKFQKYILKYYAWKNGGKIEEELLDLKGYVNDCYRCFTMLSTARTEIGVAELQRVTVARTDIIESMLSDFTVSEHCVRAFNPHQSSPSTSIIINIPDEYLKILLHSLSHHIKNASNFSRLDWKNIHKKHNPRYNHILRLGFSNTTLAQDRDLLHRDAVSLSLDILHGFDSEFTILPLFKALTFIRKLERMVRLLGMPAEAECIDYKEVRQLAVMRLSPSANFFEWYVDPHWAAFGGDRWSFKMNASHGSSAHRRAMQTSMSTHRLEYTVYNFMEFCDKHANILDESEDTRNEVELINWEIFQLYLGFQSFSLHPGMGNPEDSAKKFIKEMAEKLHKLNTSLPLWNA